MAGVTEGDGAGARRGEGDLEDDISASWLFTSLTCYPLGISNPKPAKRPRPITTGPVIGSRKLISA